MRRTDSQSASHPPPTELSPSITPSTSATHSTSPSPRASSDYTSPTSSTSARPTRSLWGRLRAYWARTPRQQSAKPNKTDVPVEKPPSHTISLGSLGCLGSLPPARSPPRRRPEGARNPSAKVTKPSATERPLTPLKPIGLGWRPRSPRDRDCRSRARIATPRTPRERKPAPPKPVGADPSPVHAAKRKPTYTPQRGPKPKAMAPRKKIKTPRA